MSARPAFTSIISILIQRTTESIFQGLCVAVTFLGLLIATLSKKYEKKLKAANAVEKGTERLRHASEAWVDEEELGILAPFKV